jgi:hypothetical protein
LIWVGEHRVDDLTIAAAGVATVFVCQLFDTELGL